ncbi:gamma-glutamyltransferase, partial [Roseovarius sp.]|uniref:gamma-glutamyltransferase n=1 Tax=Roseovarius sp. TaxID=1486281 RepID=UPI00356A7066
MVVILSSADWKPAAGQNENAIHVKNRETMPERGWDSVTVPGAVGGWVALSDRFGKLPFAKLF